MAEEQESGNVCVLVEIPTLLGCRQGKIGEVQEGDRVSLSDSTSPARSNANYD